MRLRSCTNCSLRTLIFAFDGNVRSVLLAQQNLFMNISRYFRLNWFRGLSPFSLRLGLWIAVLAAAFSLSACRKKAEPSFEIDPKERARRDSLEAFFTERNRKWRICDSLYYDSIRKMEQQCTHERKGTDKTERTSHSRSASTPYSEGYADGDDAGYKDGYHKSYKKHYDDSSSYSGAKASDYADGYEAGYEEGYQRGKNRGEFDRGYDSGVYGENTHGYDRDNYDPYMDDATDDW